MELAIINDTFGYTGNGIPVYTQNLYDNLLKYGINAEKVSISDYIGLGNLHIAGMRTYKKLYYKIIPFAKYFFIWGYVSGILRLGSQEMIDRLDPSPTPAKPPVSDGRTSENRSDSNEKRTAQGRGATWETGGRLSSKKNKKEQKNL